MLTLKFKYSTSQKDRENILSYQKAYSMALRKVYNNLDLTADENFKEEIREKFDISAKQYEYIVSEAETLYKKWEARRERLEGRISKLEESFKNAPKHKKKKLNERMQRLRSSLNKDICFGGANNLREISKNPKSEEAKRKYEENRNWMMQFQGEASRKGNRFFDLSGLSEGKITFKKNRKKKIELEFSVKGGKRKRELERIEKLALNGDLSVSIGLSYKYICISYDEATLYGTSFDKKGAYKEVKHIQDKEERKKALAHMHREHEDRIFKDKIRNRYMAVDINPDGVGLCVLDRKIDDPRGDIRVIHKEYIGFEGLNKKLGRSSSDKKQKKRNNKRKYEISVAVKKIFTLARHFKVSHFVSEELELEGGDTSSREGNRKINNLWSRELFSKLFQKHINKEGMKWVEVNPAYSSFIGNIIYKEYDPVAASIEIGRRGVVKYLKGGSIFPEFPERSLINAEIYDGLKAQGTWRGLYASLSSANKSVRRKRSGIPPESFSANWMDSRKSKVERVVFS